MSIVGTEQEKDLDSRTSESIQSICDNLTVWTGLSLFIGLALYVCS